MIRQDIDINGYWSVTVVYDAYLGKLNTGFTYTDSNRRRSVIGISKATSHAQLMNTIVHEAKHLQSHICNYYNVDEDSEDAAYLIGYIIQKMYSVFKTFIKGN